MFLQSLPGQPPSSCVIDLASERKAMGRRMPQRLTWLLQPAQDGSTSWQRSKMQRMITVYGQDGRCSECYQPEITEALVIVDECHNIFRPDVSYEFMERVRGHRLLLLSDASQSAATLQHYSFYLTYCMKHVSLIEIVRSAKRIVSRATAF